MPNPTGGEENMFEQAQTLRRNWCWLVSLGSALVLLGIVAVAKAVFVSLAAGVFIAILVVLGGIAHLVEAFTDRKKSGFFVQLILGILFVLIGTFLLSRPLLVATAFTLIVGIALLIHGVGQVILAVQHRNVPNWFFFVLSGAIGAILGLFILLGWPFTFDIIGVFIGISLIIEGLSFVMFGIAVKSIPKKEDGANDEASASAGT